MNLLTSKTKDGWLFTCGAGSPESWAAHAPLLANGKPARLAPLLQWLETDDADIATGTGVLATHDTVADLTDGELAGLGLPHACPFKLEISSRGNIARSDFTFEYTFLDLKAREVSDCERDGSTIRVSEGDYILQNPLYDAIELMDAFNNSPPDSREDRFLILQELKTLLPEGAITDQYITRMTIARADAFALATGLDDAGMFSFDPVPVTRTSASDLLDFARDDFEDALPEAPSKRFAGQFQSRGALSSYALGQCYLVLLPKVRQALAVAHRYQSGSVEQRKAFFTEPRRCLKEALGDQIDEDLIESLFFESEGYSERVRDIGEFVKPILPYKSAPAEIWLPPELLGTPVATAIESLPAEKLTTLQELLEQALASPVEIPIVIFEGQEFPVQQNVLDAIRTRIETGAEVKDEDPERKKSPAPGATAQYVLQIDRNLDTVTFTGSGGEPITVCNKLTGLASEPLQHQSEGIAWLQERFSRGKTGALLADDMGLGKTFQVLAFLRWLRKLKDDGARILTRTLIVAPTGLLKNWEEEHGHHLSQKGLGSPMRLYGADLKEIRHKAAGRGELDTGEATLDLKRIEHAQWALTTYETLRDYQFSLGRIDWGCIVYDEIQKIKNPAAQVTDAAKGLRGKFKIGLTGTPVENSLADLWCVTDTVQPGVLGSLKSFGQTYDESSDASLRSLQDRITTNESPAIMLRRMKNDHLPGLPEKHVFVKQEDMPPAQAQAYTDAVKGGHRSRASRGWMLEVLHKLRSISLHPSLRTDQSDEEYISQSARLKVLFGLLDNFHIKGEKSLVFLESLSMQGILCEIIQARYQTPRPPLVISGKVAGADRQARVNRFQSSPGFDVMILSPKAGGVGLTLTAARNVVHLSRWWNPAVEDQCTDRVYRIGQKKSVNVYLPLARHPVYDNISFDFRLHELIERKRQMSRTLLAPPIGTGDDLRDLFGSLEYSA